MKKFVWVLLVTLLLSVTYANLEPTMVEVKAHDQGYTPQPNYWNSTLSVYSADCKAPGKKDWELKKLIEKYIVPSGYHSMKFVFGQCYGGGFLDEIQQFGSDAHPVVGMSGCKWHETAKACWPKDGKYTEFLHHLKNALDKSPPPTMKSAFEEAKKNDPSAPTGNEADHNPTNGEHPQYVSVGANADNLKLGNASTAKSWKALLFVGKDTDERHRNNLKEIHDTLTKKYGYTEDDIEALCGDGNATEKGMPWLDGNATQPSLENALKKIGEKMNSTEQFFFWANDHGDIEFSIYKWLTYIIEEIKEFSFTLPSWMIEDMKAAITNFPYISMDTFNVTTTNNAVYLNDVSLGNLSYTGTGGTHHEIFYLDENIVSEDNVLTIFRMQETSFAISNVDISSGSIPEETKVPPVGGITVPVDKLGLLAPYISIALTILVATATTAFYAKRVKRKKEK